MGHIVGIDIGGSHIAGALVDQKTLNIVDESYVIFELQPDSSPSDFISNLERVIKNLKKTSPQITRVAVSIPGPFDNTKGISKIHGVGKFERLFGLNIKQTILSLTNDLTQKQVVFFNDATAYLKGEIELNQLVSKKVLGITLGTGFGSSFFIDGAQVKNIKGVPENGFLFDQSYKESNADDYFSTRWFIDEYKSKTGNEVRDVKELANLAKSDLIARQVFETFGKNLSTFLLPFIEDFEADVLLIGGNISKAKELFLPLLDKGLNLSRKNLQIIFSHLGEKAAIIGACSLNVKNENRNQEDIGKWRKTEQLLPPLLKPDSKVGKYDIYPAFKIEPGKIKCGFHDLANEIKNSKNIIIDGYGGVFWEYFIKELGVEFYKQDIPFRFFDISSAMKSEFEIAKITELAIGEKDSIFGKRYSGKLEDFFEPEKLALIKPDESKGINIVYGIGASLAGWDGLLIYVDVPKNEIQFRSRAGTITNLGFETPLPPKEMYKRFYFIDWIVLNKHKEKLVQNIDILVDEQRRENVVFMAGNDFRESLARMSENYFRVRPWFEPGPWGGTWMKDNIDGLATDVPNYAWSFELIVPENGLMLESSGRFLEFSFDFLMYTYSEKILGDAHNVFQNEFPIRFDFLDTFDGGNLSVQCHPRPDYIREQFGESFTQDETYYILDAKEDSEVYLGFQKGINPDDFKKTLKASFVKNEEIDIPKYVQVHPSKKHDLFLIPNGTIHASGKNNLVLEISSTPYIFTFKMYDWLRLDLDGNPRPINIDHAFNNLYFERKGERVMNELISKPRLIEKGEDIHIYHLPTHESHFYDVHRIEFENEVEIETKGKCHVCMLVEGESILLETPTSKAQFYYAETFVIPAATKKYRIINEGKQMAKVIKAFVKDDIKI